MSDYFWILEICLGIVLGAILIVLIKILFVLTNRTNNKNKDKTNFRENFREYSGHPSITEAKHHDKDIACVVKQVRDGVKDESNFEAIDSHSSILLNKIEFISLSNKIVTTASETFESRKVEPVSEITKLPSGSNATPNKTSDFPCTSTQRSLSYENAVDNSTNPKIVISAPDDDLTTNPLSLGLSEIHKKSEYLARSFLGKINNKNVETLSYVSDDVSYSSMYSSEETSSHEGSRSRSSIGTYSNMGSKALQLLSDQNSSNSSFQKEQRCKQFIGLKPPNLNYLSKSKMPEKALAEAKRNLRFARNAQVEKSDYSELFGLKAENLCQPGLAVTLNIPGYCMVECGENTFDSPVTGMLAYCAFSEQISTTEGITITPVINFSTKEDVEPKKEFDVTLNSSYETVSDKKTINIKIQHYDKTTKSWNAIREVDSLKDDSTVTFCTKVLGSFRCLVPNTECENLQKNIVSTVYLQRDTDSTNLTFLWFLCDDFRHLLARMWLEMYPAPKFEQISECKSINVRFGCKLCLRISSEETLAFAPFQTPFEEELKTDVWPNTVLYKKCGISCPKSAFTADFLTQFKFSIEVDETGERLDGFSAHVWRDGNEDTSNGVGPNVRNSRHRQQSQASDTSGCSYFSQSSASVPVNLNRGKSKSEPLDYFSNPPCRRHRFRSKLKKIFSRSKK